jgi:hypothetical protein
MGFRPNRSTTDNIFIVTHIYEKCCEFNIDIYNIFLDYAHITRVEAGSNTSTVTLRVVRGDEMGLKKAAP